MYNGAIATVNLHFLGHQSSQIAPEAGWGLKLPIHPFAYCDILDLDHMYKFERSSQSLPGPMPEVKCNLFLFFIYHKKTGRRSTLFGIGIRFVRSGDRIGRSLHHTTNGMGCLNDLLRMLFLRQLNVATLTWSKVERLLFQDRPHSACVYNIESLKGLRLKRPCHARFSLYGRPSLSTIAISMGVSAEEIEVQILSLRLQREHLQNALTLLTSHLEHLEAIEQF